MIFSLFSALKNTVPAGKITFNDFVNRVRGGYWKTIIDPIRNEPDKQKRRELKEQLPGITPAGIFDKRLDAGILEPSDLIVIDFDNISNLKKLQESLNNDPYTFCSFVSVSGNGLAVFVKIDSRRFDDSFLSLEKYYIDTYGEICDPSCKNISRFRFVSSDPDIFTNDASKVFKNYLTKEQKKPLNTQQIIYTKSDFGALVGRIVEKNTDLTNSSYERFLNIGFALAHEYGESSEGLAIYHQLTSNSAKYDPKVTDRQYKYCYLSDRRGAYSNSVVTIGTIFHYAKEAGIETISRETKRATMVAKHAYKQNSTISKDDAITRVLEVGNITKKDARQIVEQVQKQAINTKGADGEGTIQQMEIFFQMNYNFKRNSITRAIENKGVIMDTKEFNSVYMETRRVIGESVHFMDVERLINSDFTPDYNPILNFFDTNRGKTGSGLIERLAATITTDMPDKDYAKLFVKKWLVSLIAAAHWKHSPLVLVLTGGQNTGKTEWFRRLLPKELQMYYAESKLDAGKDDDILMCQKWMIVDDEFGGKSKRDMNRFKELTSKQIFSLREPYGRKNIDMQRLAVLCGTSNEKQIITDPTGNRRIIPLSVLKIDHAAYNAIDKTALLMEAYQLYIGGFEWELTQQDIAKLNNSTDTFEAVTLEGELILKYYRPTTENDRLTEFLSASEILVFLQNSTGTRLVLNRIGSELKRLGFGDASVKRFGAITKRGYNVVALNTGVQPVYESSPVQLQQPPLPGKYDHLEGI